MRKRCDLCRGPLGLPFEESNGLVLCLDCHEEEQNRNPDDEDHLEDDEDDLDFDPFDA